MATIGRQKRLAAPVNTSPSAGRDPYDGEPTGPWWKLRFFPPGGIVHGKLLLTLLVAVGAFTAKRLSSGTLPEIFGLNVVPGIAFRVVVMHVLFNGVPW
jgi:hypothetical protein